MLCLQTIFVCGGKRDILRISDGWQIHCTSSYTFLINWLERFPQHKIRDFYITGESYGGHYVPQLTYTILLNNKNTQNTIINRKGIAVSTSLNYWVPICALTSIISFLNDLGINLIGIYLYYNTITDSEWMDWWCHCVYTKTCRLMHWTRTKPTKEFSLTVSL